MGSKNTDLLFVGGTGTEPPFAEPNHLFCDLSTVIPTLFCAHLPSNLKFRPTAVESLARPLLIPQKQPLTTIHSQPHTWRLENGVRHFPSARPHDAHGGPTTRLQTLSLITMATDDEEEESTPPSSPSAAPIARRGKFDDEEDDSDVREPAVPRACITVAPLCIITFVLT